MSFKFDKTTNHDLLLHVPDNWLLAPIFAFLFFFGFLFKTMIFVSDIPATVQDVDIAYKQVVSWNCVMGINA